MVSPLNGAIALAGPTGGLWPQTFVYDPAAGTVQLYADDTAVNLDDGHRWSPDGKFVVFTRHRATGGRNSLVRLEPVTGLQDTLLFGDTFQIHGFFWLGVDSLAFFYIRSQVDFGYRVITEPGGEWQDFNEAPDVGFALPVISPDRQWMAYWNVEDSAVTGEGVVQFTRLRLRNRLLPGAEDPLLREGRFGTTGNLDRAFSPDGHFLAFCASETEVAIRDMVRDVEIKRMPIPFCWSLNWSWGPEGPPLS
jgi:hypothetical protein